MSRAFWTFLSDSVQQTTSEISNWQAHWRFFDSLMVVSSILARANSWVWFFWNTHTNSILHVCHVCTLCCKYKHVHIKSTCILYLYYSYIQRRLTSIFSKSWENPKVFRCPHQKRPTARLLVQQASLHQAGEDLYIEFEIKLLEHVWRWRESWRVEGCHI